MLPEHLSAGEVCARTLALQDERRWPVGALLRAASFQETRGEPMTIRRARALNAVLDGCDLLLTPGELLVGSGIGRFAPDGDPRALAQAQAELAEIGGRSFLTHADHAAPDYSTLLAQGIGGVRSLARAAGDSPFLSSVALALEGLQRHILRWAAAAADTAAQGDLFADLLRGQAELLEHISSAAPRSLWQALQLVVLTHSAYQLDGRYAMAIGRLDQYLLPFYEADIEAGRLCENDAQRLLDHFVAKLVHRGDIQNVCVGGMAPTGGDGTNALSFACVEAVRRIGQPGCNLTARIHPGTPPDFLVKCVECIRTGIGFPALVNDEILVPALVAQGYPLEDARDYCFVGCIETFIPGRQAPWADSRFNLLRCVDLALRDGRDGLTGGQAGPHTGHPDSWSAFYEAFCTQLRTGLSAHVNDLNAIEAGAQEHSDELTSPLLSALMADCIERGRDLCDGGARYPANHGVAGMGIGSTADSLMAVKRYVYEERRFTLAGLVRMLDANFAGYERERHILLKDAPKYGNDDERVDALAAQVSRFFAEELLRRRTPDGGRYWGLMAANVQNLSSGLEVGASPDGRLSQEPLSDAASPSFGRDRHGPTAVARSVSRLPYQLLTGGNVVNMKFMPATLAGPEGANALVSLIRTCFDLGGAQLQFNTTDRATLIDAMEHPDRYPHLVVRVSGFSAYFVSLSRAVQEDILSRTEHAFE